MKILVLKKKQEEAPPPPAPPVADDDAGRQAPPVALAGEVEKTAVAGSPKRPRAPPGYRWHTLRSGEKVLTKDEMIFPKVHRWSGYKGGDELFFHYVYKQLEILKDFDLAMNAACNATQDDW